MGHFIEHCKICGVVTRQCRCPSPNKEQRWTICTDCGLKLQKTGVEGVKQIEGRTPNDINILGNLDARLRIVHWDQLPHLQYKVGDRECWHRLQWEEFRRIALGEAVRDVLPWFDNRKNFEKEKP